MKKISIEILCDTFHVADSLRVLANYFEDEELDTKNGVELNLDHCVAEIKEIEC